MKEIYLVALSLAASGGVFSAVMLLCKMRREHRSAPGGRDAAYRDYLRQFEDDGYDEMRR